MARRKRLAPGETACPICGNGPVVKVGVYEPYKDDEEPAPPSAFGLAFQGEDGRTCCSFDEGRYATREEAQAAADSRTFSQWMAEEDRSYMDDWEDLIGDQYDGDPYDRDTPQW